REAGHRAAAPPVPQRDQVEEVAGRLPRGNERRGDLPALDGGRRVGQEAGLDVPGDLKLLRAALVLECVAVDLDAVQCRGDLRRERLGGGVHCVDAALRRVARDEQPADRLAAFHIYDGQQQHVPGERLVAPGRVAAL